MLAPRRIGAKIPERAMWLGMARDASEMPGTTKGRMSSPAVGECALASAAFWWAKRIASSRRLAAAAGDRVKWLVWVSMKTPDRPVQGLPGRVQRLTRVQGDVASRQGCEAVDGERAELPVWC